MTVLLAISEDGYIFHRSYRGGMNLERFQEFLDDMMGHFPDEYECTIICDNARPHVRVENPTPTAQVKFLPAYSPFLNPVEAAFSAYKAFIKRELAVSQDQYDDLEAAAQAGQTLQQFRLQRLMALAERAIDTLTPEKCRAWDHRVYAYILDCLSFQEIEG